MNGIGRYTEHVRGVLAAHRSSLLEGLKNEPSIYDEDEGELKHTAWAEAMAEFLYETRRLDAAFSDLLKALPETPEEEAK